MKTQILLIEHHGYPFSNSACAVRLATGFRHHIVLLITE